MNKLILALAFTTALTTSALAAALPYSQYDGIVFASDINGPDFVLEPKDIYLALAAQIVVDGKLVDNPNKTWNNVNDQLPDWPIIVYIPGEKHDTREVFEKKILLEGCSASIFGNVKRTDDVCIQVRKDGVAIDIDGDYTETLAHLISNPKAIGIFGLSFYENNIDKLKVNTFTFKLNE